MKTSTKKIFYRKQVLFMINTFNWDEYFDDDDYPMIEGGHDNDDEN